jgi:hypothetical protein
MKSRHRNGPAKCLLRASFNCTPKHWLLVDMDMRPFGTWLFQHRLTSIVKGNRAAVPLCGSISPPHPPHLLQQVPSFHGRHATLTNGPHPNRHSFVSKCYSLLYLLAISDELCYHDRVSSQETRDSLWIFMELGINMPLEVTNLF